MSSRRRANAQSGAKCRAWMHRLSWRKSSARPNERAGAYSAEEQRVLENFGQAAEFQRLAQSRVARIHSFPKPGRSARGPAIVRSLSRRDYPEKNYRFGQAYGADGAPLKLINYTPVTREDTQVRGILPFIEPLPRFNLSNPGNILRIFEKGGRPQLSLGLPTSSEPGGKPEHRLSERGLGTLNRTDPVFLGLQKTRLHDPLLGFFGSNDHPGDYRSSGCSACHVVYANDRSPTNSGLWSKFGHQGLSFTSDESIPKT